MATSELLTHRPIDLLLGQKATEVGDGITIGHRELDLLASELGIGPKHFRFFKKKSIRLKTRVLVQKRLAELQKEDAERKFSRVGASPAEEWDTLKGRFKSAVQEDEVDLIELQETREGRLVLVKNADKAAMKMFRVYASTVTHQDNTGNFEAAVMHQHDFQELVDQIAKALNLDVSSIITYLSNLDSPIVDTEGNLNEQYALGSRPLMDNPVLQNLRNLRFVRQTLDQIEGEEHRYYWSGSVSPKYLLATLDNLEAKLNLIENRHLTSYLASRIAAIRQTTRKKSKISRGIRVWKEAPNYNTILTRLGYKKVKVLGSGAMSRVYLYKHRNGGKIAVKVFTDSDGRPKPANKAKLKRGITALANSNHVVKVIKIISGSGNPRLARTDLAQGVIFEYVEGEDFVKYLTANAGRVTQTDIKHMNHMRRGLVTLHRAKIFHSDLKPSNALIGSRGLKICDFGISHSSDSSRWGFHRLRDSGFWTPPEMSRGSLVSAKVNEWGYGVCLYSSFVAKNRPSQQLSQTLTNLKRSHRKVKKNPAYVHLCALQQVEAEEAAADKPKMELLLKENKRKMREGFEEMQRLNQELKAEEREVGLERAQEALDTLRREGGGKGKEILELEVQIRELEARLTRLKAELGEKEESLKKAHANLYIVVEALAISMINFSQSYSPRKRWRTNRTINQLYLKTIKCLDQKNFEKADECLLRFSHFTTIYRARLLTQEKNLKETVERLQIKFEEEIFEGIAVDHPDRKWMIKHTKAFLQINPSKRMELVNLEKDPFFMIYDNFDLADEQARFLGMTESDFTDVFISKRLFRREGVCLVDRFDDLEDIREDEEFIEAVSECNQRLLEQAKEVWIVTPPLIEEEWGLFLNWSGVLPLRDLTNIINFTNLKVQFDNFLIIREKLSGSDLSEWRGRCERAGLLMDLEGKRVFVPALYRPTHTSSVTFALLDESREVQGEFNRFLGLLINQVHVIYRLQGYSEETILEDVLHYFKNVTPPITDQRGVLQGEYAGLDAFGGLLGLEKFQAVIEEINSSLLLLPFRVYLSHYTKMNPDEIKFCLEAINMIKPSEGYLLELVDDQKYEPINVGVLQGRFSVIKRITEQLRINDIPISQWREIILGAGLYEEGTFLLRSDLLENLTFQREDLDNLRRKIVEASTS